ncbi:MAG TPA: alpha/beta hydrolase [Rhodocyclaceae bacterium]|nr:alpha/beta hydrolase [Rhodocyclaceae bacterium]
MTQMRERSVQCIHPGGMHRMAFTEWGDPTNPRVLICVHGLTRCGRDFDDLAAAMSDHYRVVCPDVAGRGQSEWLPDPIMYSLQQYGADMMALLTLLAPQTLDWVGTSMGGLIGMGIAAQANSPIHKLVLNDVGPVITAVSLQRIGQYLGNAPRFNTYAEGEAFVRMTSPGFGALTDAQWQHLSTHVLHRADDGKFEFLYDPAIAESFSQALVASGGLDIELWPLYDMVSCPTLLLRGANSDLLTRETAQAMTQRGPKAQLVEIDGVGHAPSLMPAAQIEIVKGFLLAGS